MKAAHVHRNILETMKFPIITIVSLGFIVSATELLAEKARVLGLRGEVICQFEEQSSELQASGKVPAGATLRTGPGSDLVLAVLPECRIHLLAVSDLQLGKVTQGVQGERVDPFPRSVSAMNPVLTNNPSEVPVYAQQPARVDVALRSGAGLFSMGPGELTVRFSGGEVSASQASFVVNAMSPDRVRLTVATGAVNVRLADGRSFQVESGQFSRVWSGSLGIGFDTPGTTAADFGAKSDLAALQKSEAAFPEPIAEGSTQPAARSSASAPFDLAGSKEKRLLLPPNEANISGPVQSPEEP